jgi:hypothetical protein
VVSVVVAVQPHSARMAVSFRCWPQVLAGCPQASGEGSP